MGQNKAQREAAKRAAKANEQANEQKPDVAPNVQDAIDLCGPKPTEKAIAKVAKIAEKAEKAKKTPEAPRPVCSATKKDGTKCTARCVAVDGKVQATCVDHQPAWERMTHEEHVAFGEWLRRAKGPEIVEVIGWWKAKQIAKDRMAPALTEQEQQIEK